MAAKTVRKHSVWLRRRHRSSQRIVSSLAWALTDALRFSEIQSSLCAPESLQPHQLATWRGKLRGE